MKIVKDKEDKKIEDFISFLENKYGMRRVSESRTFTPSGGLHSDSLTYANDDLMISINKVEQMASMVFAKNPKVHVVAQCKTLIVNRSVFSSLADEYTFIAKNFNG
jgi:hypothetical protein